MDRRKFNPAALFLVIALTLILFPIDAQGQSANVLAEQNAVTMPPARRGDFHIERLDSPTGVSTGMYTSMILIPDSGQAEVSYYDFTHGWLRWANQTFPGLGNCAGNLNFKCQTVDNGGSAPANIVGMSTSIDFYRGTGSISTWGTSYYDGTSHSLKYAEYVCSIVNCTLTTETIMKPITPSNTSLGGWGTSLRFDSTGNPHIAFSNRYDGNHNMDGVELAYRVAKGGNCGWENYGEWQCDFIESGSYLGQYPSLFYTHQSGSDAWAIAYSQGDASPHLRYAAKATPGNCGPGNTWQCSSIDTAGGRWPSLHLDASGVPGIAYYDPDSGNLKYAYRTSINANCGMTSDFTYRWRCDAIDLMGTYLTQAGLSMDLDQAGAPAIAYMHTEDQGLTTLNFARPKSAYGLAVGNCGPSNNWICDYVDSSGNPDVYEGAFASLALRPNGLAVIAYTEDDSNAGLTRLKLAQQKISVFLPITRK